MTTQVAFLFPGQGSQAVGMGADVYASSPAAKQVFDTVDTALGFSLSRLCFEGPEETLRETINAQPALVTVSAALLAAFQESLISNDGKSSGGTSSWSSPLTPSFTAGHSVGEYTALVAASSLDLQEAAVLVRERGRLMHHEGTVCAGGMAAIIGMDGEVLQAVCQQATQETLQHVTSPSVHPGQGKVAVANYNAPGQIVISGEQQALARASELAKERGAKRVIPLSVSGAFHSPVMEPAANGLAQALQTAQIRNAHIPVIGNISATPLTSPSNIREELEHQVATPVQWIRTIEYMAQAGVSVFIEIGPGQALTGMVKRIAKGATTLTISSAEEVEKAVRTVREMRLLGNV